MPEPKKPVEILLVEDNLGDIRLIEEVFKDTAMDNNLMVAQNGEIAMEILRKEGEYSNAPRPDIILLDLNLPRKDGREVLKEIKEDDALKSVPVVILTTSTAEEDIIETHKNNANCYINKPFDLDNYIKVIKIIEEFWVNTVILPPK